MSGNVIDLATPIRSLPDLMVVDTSVVVARLLVPEVQSNPLSAQRAVTFFDDLQIANRQVVLTPTGFSELLHISIKARYQRELRLNRQSITARYGTRITSWTALYKRDPSILRQHVTHLEQLHLKLVATNIVIVAPDDLDSISSGRSYNEEFIHLIGRYELDTNDTLILMEASRLGIPAIVTMDADLHRAAIDFESTPGSERRGRPGDTGVPPTMLRCRIPIECDQMFSSMVCCHLG